MNIGIFTDCYLPTKNGVATAIVQTKQELEHRGHRVVVFTVASPGAGGQDDAVYRFPSLPFNASIEVRVGLARQADVNRIIERERLDLIHTHTEFALGWAGKRAALRAKLPLLHTAHTLYEAYLHYLPLGRLWPHSTVQWALARFLAGYDGLICPSAKMQTYVAAFMPSLRAVVIGNGVLRESFDPERLTEADRARTRTALGLDPCDRVILYVGRIAPEKRVMVLFDALRPLLAGCERYKALFVGSGPAQEELAKAVHRAGLGRQARLTGLVSWERMGELYAIAHAFATASLSEVHPMTLIEAATCGLPIVARRDDAFTDLVKDGYNGFLVDSDHAIAEKLSELLRDETQQRAFTRNARTLSDQFTIEAHVDKLEALYRQVITHAEE